MRSPRAIARELRPDDEILLTTLDHDANYSPWKALEEKGVVIRQVDIRESDCTLDLDDLKSKLNEKTRLVAGVTPPIPSARLIPSRKSTRLAHAAGAMIYVDAVHYAPHGVIDVKALDCDFLVCSPYKFFGPHMARSTASASTCSPSVHTGAAVHRPGSRSLGKRDADSRIDRRHWRRRRISGRTRAAAATSAPKRARSPGRRLSLDRRP